MNPRRRLPGALAGLLLLACRPADAAERAKVALLMSDNNPIYVKIAKGIRETAQGEIKDISLGGSGEAVSRAILDFNPDLLVAIGDAAVSWADRNFAGRPRLASGVVRQAKSRAAADSPGVSLDFSPAAYLRLIKEALPEARRVGLILSHSGVGQDFQQSARELGLEINVRSVQKEKAVGQAMQALKDWGVEVFLVTFDPLVMNPETWKYLVGFSVVHKVGLVVPSKALLKNGGVLSLEADYHALGRQTGALVNDAVRDPGLLEGGGFAYAVHGETGINLKMMEALGLKLRDSVRKSAVHVYQ
ncbi:MAG: ABC transporter substrate-binding protein [Elusimicrobiota bacterium]